MPELSVGHAVQLKSGGPKTAILWLSDRDYRGIGYGYTWFPGNHERKFETFSAAIPELVEDE